MPARGYSKLLRVFSSSLGSPLLSIVFVIDEFPLDAWEALQTVVSYHCPVVVNYDNVIMTRCWLLLLFPVPSVALNCLIINFHRLIHSWEPGRLNSWLLRVWLVAAHGTWITIWSQLIIHTLQIYIIPVTQKSLRVKHSDNRRINECAQQSQSQTIFGMKNIHHFSKLPCVTFHRLYTESKCTIKSDSVLGPSSPRQTPLTVDWKGPVIWSVCLQNLTVWQCDTLSVQILSRRQGLDSR